MTTLHTIAHAFTIRPANAATAHVPQLSTLQSRRRERDFGVGYGNSSGYASDKRYASPWGQLRFRCG